MFRTWPTPSPKPHSALVRTVQTFVAAASLSALIAAPAAANDGKSLWAQAVQARIDQAMTYPVIAVRNAEQGAAVMRLDVDAVGTIQGSSLIKSTGSAALDREAEHVVSRLGTLPATPSGTRSTVLMRLDFAIAHDAAEEAKRAREIARAQQETSAHDLAVMPTIYAAIGK
jgi:TonB family protein